jgi:two-component system chemotaxis response regulator CheB
MSPIRVLVTEDSLTVRRRIVESLAADREIMVVGEAEDGQRAIELCEALRPDVVTLDMMLPVMNGLAATEHIMAYFPTPILIVSSSTNRGELFKTYEALSAGAIDVLEKPAGTEPDGVWERKLVAAVKLISRIKVITHPRARLGAMGQRQLERLSWGGQDGTSASRAVRRPRVVAIGVSTGGPGALAESLCNLPTDFPLPILLVIHIASLFAPGFAEWLSTHSALPVAYARDGDRLPAIGDARVLMAPPDRHLVLAEGKLRLTADPERHSCRPAVDVLFGSLAREVGRDCIACLLTGMGKDGAEGLLAVRRAGGRTIAQDEKSSVVFGMPREAILLGAAEQVLPLSRVAATLGVLAGEASKGRSS